MSTLYQKLKSTHDWINQFEKITNENKVKAKPMSIRNKSNKHARRFISSKKVHYEPWDEIADSTKRSKVPKNKPSPLHFSWWHKVPKTKNVCLSKRHVIGIKYQLKITNVIKHIGLLPQDVCIIYDFAFEYKMHTNEIITLHIYIQTLVMFKKGKKLQYQFKERCFTQSRIASQRIVHY